MPPVVVLYEDARAAGSAGQSFGLHELVVALVGDVLPEELRYTLAQTSGIQPVPKNGVDNVLRALQSDYDLLGRGNTVFGLVDADKLAEHVRRAAVPALKAGATPEEARDAWLAQHPQAERVRLLLLDRNLESVLRTIAECDRTVPKTLIDDALAKRTGMQARERLLHRAAHGERSLRDCVQQRVPTLTAVRDHLKAALPVVPPRSPGRPS